MACGNRPEATCSVCLDFYRDSEKLQGTLAALRKQMEDLFESHSQDEGNLIKLKRKADCLRKDISCEFAKLHQFLDEEEQALIPKLAQEEAAVLWEIEENARRASAQSASVNQTIADIQKRLSLQETGSLEDIKSITNRVVVKFGKPGKAFLGLNLGEFGGPLQYRLWKRMLKVMDPVPAPLTMDPRSAHPLLLLSDDRTQVTVSSHVARQLSEGSGRFSDYPSVLGSEGFISGRHYWEVEVGGNTAWDVGVARESVRGKELLTLETKTGIWAVALWYGEYIALTSPRTHLVLSAKLKKLGVYLDYEAGQVSLYNADGMSHLYTFSDRFTEKMYPYFNTYCSADTLKLTPLQI
ncbi:zinc-binding protein A33-like [Heptranchias perlo]|uniref:zinc-binding protein A33-like n=1 Tax=Heptranchias perlo TaxID=212740 RepID=UPI0035595248